METLVQLALTNAAMALVLAVPAALAGLLRCRPALVHGLWLLVLLKLITPPLVSIPVPAFAAGAEVADRLAEADLPAPVPAPMVAQPVDDEFDLRLLELPERADQLAAPVEVVAAPAVPETTSDVASGMDTARLLAGGLVAVWAAGCLLFAIIAVVRCVRFKQVLKHSAPADAELDEHVVALAEQLGLRQLPEVRLVPGAVSPMIWGLGRRACLLIPAELFARLEASQRDALLVHELAHLRRGDHWVRLLELAASCFFWWHPVLWWARHALHEAEEQCCDAWVVWALPGSARDYAEALLETVDFLSEARPALPPAASGIGQVRKLKRRLTMIMQANTPRTLSVVGFVVLFCLGALLLPLVPDLVQAQEPEVKILVKKLIGESNPNQDPEVQQAVQKLLEKITQAKNEEEVEAAVAALTRLLKEQKARQAARDKDRDAAAKAKEAQIAQLKAEVERAEAQLRQAHEQLMQAHRKLAEVTGGAAGLRDRILFLKDVRMEPGAGIRVPPPPMVGVPGVRVPDPRGTFEVEIKPLSREDRLTMLEKQLAELLREVKSLKEEKPKR